MNKHLLAFIATALITNAALADVVYVTARPSPCTVTTTCPGPNTDGTYSEQFPNLGDFGAVGSAPGHPQTTVARTYISAAFITDTNAGVILTPTLGVAGGTYQIDYNFNSLAGNTSTNIVMSVACTNGGALSFTNTDKFKRIYGNPANQWRLMGYLTNNVGSTTPTIVFRYESGTVSGSSPGNRLLFDSWRFTLVQPCLSVGVVGVTGPLSADTSTVAVTGVSASATNINVYQDSGAGMVLIGSKPSGVTESNNTVTVSGLVKGAQVAATQTINGQEGCVPTAGTIVGGGANPRVRMALSIRETTSTGPIGSPGVTTNTAIHFLGATTVVGGSPGDGLVVYPSNDWQTVTFDRGTVFLDNSSNAVGSVAEGPGYNPSDSLMIEVYAFQTVPANSVQIYSRVGAQSAAVTSNDFFSVNWTWDAVAGADGYRLLRNLNSAGFAEYVDVFAATTFNDQNNSWTAGNTVTPTFTQTNSSIQWNPSANQSPNNIPGQWATLDAIAFVIDDLSDTGPYDLYIDNLQNGSTVWQTFENYPGNTQDVGFRHPLFSGTTSGNLLAAPDRAVVSVRAADTGTKSFHVRFQWVGTNETRWLRLTTSGVGNPQVNLDQPVSFRLLMQPVGATLPPQAPPPTLTINRINGESVLDWTGGHNLQTAEVVGGPYTNVPSITLGPWTNNYAEPERFFRLADPLDN